MDVVPYFGLLLITPISMTKESRPEIPWMISDEILAQLVDGNTSDQIKGSG
jgi:hypothetical protein